MTPAVKAILLIALTVGIAGCLVQEKPIEERKERSTTSTPLFSSPSPLANATVQANATANPSTTPEPTSEATPNATQTPGGECSISANPKDAPGPFKALASARFFNTPNPENVTIKCTAEDAGTPAEKHGEFYIVSCSYSYAIEKKIVTISAEAQGISCATTVVVDVNSEFKKGWTFTPGDEEFTLNQSVSNTTVRGYTIANSGSLTLTQITCTTDKSFVAMSCPATLKPGESLPFTATFSVSGLTPGQYSVVITIKEKELEKSFYVVATLET